MGYETVIGLEVHCQLLTDSKLFCGCSTDYIGKEPNTNVCPVCLGLPGSLPVLNKKALEFALKAAIALNCEILPYSHFYRKNYFYPDLPKAYQITQYDIPVGRHGWIELPYSHKRIGITRIHLEEDAGKLVHPTKTGRIEHATYSLVDYNRAGVPLIEIVSEPDFSSPSEAREYLMELRSIVQHLGISDGNMELGSMRCDANVSVHRKGEELGVKVELKNMNSFKALERALNYEVERQIKLIESGERVEQETRHWSEPEKKTISLRGKEEAQDYRYFPEPDLLPIYVDEEVLESIKSDMPELPANRRKRFVSMGIGEKEASIMVIEKSIGDYFEEAVKYFDDAKSVANWILGDFLGELNKAGLEIQDSKVKPHQLGRLLTLIKDGTISGKIAKKVFNIMFDTGDDPDEIVKREGLVQIVDRSEIEKVVEEVLSANPDAVESYRKGKANIFNFLVGQVMKATKGKANPNVVRDILQKKI